MKLVFSSTSYATYDRRMQRICGALVDAGYDVSWYSRVSQEIEDTKGIHHRKMNCWFNNGFLFYAEFNLRLFGRLLVAKADIFSAVDLDTLLAVTLAAKLRGKKIVFDSHEYFSEVPELNGRTFVKSVWKKLARFCIPRTNLNYTVGLKLAERLEEDYQAKFDVIRNIGTYEQTADTIPERQNRNIVYLGVLNEGRGLETMILSLLELPKAYRLLLVGEGDLSSALRDLVKENALTERVIFMGMRAPQELHNILKNAWCGINLLDRRSESYYYSLANKFFDYTNANLPSVTMKFPEYQAINAKYPTSILIDDVNKACIIQAMNSLENIQLYNKLANNCLALKKKYNWSTEKVKLIKLYKSLS